MSVVEFQLKAVGKESFEETEEEISGVATKLIGVFGGEWECIDEHVFPEKIADVDFKYHATGRFIARMKFMRRTYD